jgi:hypothetical protein
MNLILPHSQEQYLRGSSPVFVVPSTAGVKGLLRPAFPFMLETALIFT